MRKFVMRYLILLLLFLTGCAIEPLHGPPVETTYVEIDHFHPTPNNKYAIFLIGGSSICSASKFSTNELDELSQPIKDIYIEHDISETAKLAISKGYQIHLIHSVSELDKLIACLEIASNDQTQILIALSGEGDQNGFIFNLVHLTGGFSLVPPDKKLFANSFPEKIQKISGKKAIIINACQSGCFVESFRKSPNFMGVVIAACPIGYATTNCERTQTSAVYAGFLGLYQDSQAIKNLATEEIKAGHWFENIRHQLSDIGSGGLSISYDIVRYSTADFLF